MGLEVGNKILAEDFIALKARVKAECKRRKYKGSIEKYGGSEYDYDVMPVQGGLILAEHMNKLVEPMNKINDTGYTTVKAGDAVVALDELEAFVTASEAYPVQGTSSNCKSSCTGLCLGGCGSGCTGCGDSCSNACSNSCSGGCTGSCSGGCGAACSKSCTTGCTNTCGQACGGNCAGTCYGGCKSGCSGSCDSTCGYNCAYGDD